MEKMNEEKQKKIQRAQKFGLVTKEIEEEKRQERAIKFGLMKQNN